MWLMDSSRLRGSAVISPDPVRVNLESVSRLLRLLIPSITQSLGPSLVGSSISMTMMILISNGVLANVADRLGHRERLWEDRGANLRSACRQLEETDFASISPHAVSSSTLQTGWAVGTKNITICG